jgi:hypothetical protein
MNKIEIWLLALTISAILSQRCFRLPGQMYLLGDIAVGIMAMVYYPFGFFITNSIPTQEGIQARIVSGDQLFERFWFG